MIADSRIVVKSPNASLKNSKLSAGSRKIKMRPSWILNRFVYIARRFIFSCSKSLILSFIDYCDFHNIFFLFFFDFELLIECAEDLKNAANNSIASCYRWSRF